jgi:hypothetical protein
MVIQSGIRNHVGRLVNNGTAEGRVRLDRLGQISGLLLVSLNELKNKRFLEFRAKTTG